MADFGFVGSFGAWDEPDYVASMREIELLVDHGVRHFQVSLDSRDERRRSVDEVVPHVRLEPRTAA